MPMMLIGIMGMAVNHRRVAMPVAVRLTRLDARQMIMLVVCIVDVAMLVSEHLMGMFVAVGFC